MPNRIIKESICTNEQIDGLTAFEETVFYRLIVICDDFGRFDGRISVLKGRMFPLRDEKLKLDALEKAMKSLERAGLVEFYKVEGKPFLQLTGWKRNQQIRAKYSKFPAPEDADPYEIPASEGNSDHMTSNDGCLGEEHATAIKPTQAQTEPAVILLPLNDGTFHGVIASEVEKYRELYPAVDVMQELRNMVGWLDSNPSRRKTKGGVRKFITGWLSREQDRGGNHNGQRAKPGNGWSGSGNSDRAVTETGCQESRFGALPGTKKL